MNHTMVNGQFHSVSLFLLLPLLLLAIVLFLLRGGISGMFDRKEKGHEFFINGNVSIEKETENNSLHFVSVRRRL